MTGWGGMLRGGRSKGKAFINENASTERKPPVPTQKSLKDSKNKVPSHAEDTIASSPAPDHESDGAQSNTSLVDTANNVKVMIRVRPTNEREIELAGDSFCLQERGSSSLHLRVDERTYDFKFDELLGSDGSQEELFQLVGVPMVSNVMQGYNACCFAYGQTGAGKTHTMQGELQTDNGTPSHFRGLAPRVFQQIFQAIENKEGEQQGDQLQYTCRCSFLQIYNEQISDLLLPGDKSLQLRFDNNTGVYVEGLSEQVVVNAEDAMKLMIRGAQNRHVGETKMNRASSRSHSVFTMRVECRTMIENGLSKMRYGTLHIVDLAGSERVKISGATGAALTEASEINVSLTTLGRVISKVVESQQTKLPGRHIPYRDSKLTFLLQDSLGGNAKTMLVANVSPSVACAHETLSTLQFAERAKCIKNRAKVNVDTQGDKRALQAELERLQAELASLQDGVTGPLRAERDSLKTRLDDTASALRDMTSRCENAEEQNAHLTYQVKRLDEKLISKDKEIVSMDERIARLIAGKEDDVRQVEAEHQQTLKDLAAAHEAALSDASAVAQDAVNVAMRRVEETLASVRAEAANKAAAAANELAAVRSEAEAAAAAQVAALQALREEHAALMATAVAEHQAAVEEVREEASRMAREAGAAAAAEDVSERLGAELKAARAEVEAAVAAASAAATAATAQREEQLKAARTEAEAAAIAAAEDAAAAQAEAVAAARAEAAAVHAVEVEAMQSELQQALSAAQKELAALQQASAEERESAEKQRTEAAAASERSLADATALVEGLQAQLVDAQTAVQQAEAALAEKAASAQAAAAAAAEELARTQATLRAEVEKASDAKGRLDDAHAQLQARGGDISVANETIRLREAALDDMKARTAAAEEQLALEKTESHKALQTARAELTTALQAHRMSETRAAAAEAAAAERTEALAEAREEVTLLKGRVTELEGRLTEAAAAAAAAAEERRAAEGALREGTAKEVEAARGEARAEAAAEAEGVRLRELAAAAESAAAAERMLREEHSREVEAVRADARAAAAAAEATGAALRADAAAAAERAAAAEVETATARREAEEAAAVTAVDVQRMQVEWEDWLAAKDDEIARLRVSLERAEAHETAETARLEECVMELEGQCAALRAELDAARTAATIADEVASATGVELAARHAAEVERFMAERDSQRVQLEAAVAAHASALEELEEKHTAEKQAVREELQEALTAAEAERAAVAEAQSAATAAAEREAAQRDGLEAAEERAAALDADLEAARHEAEELREELAGVRSEEQALRATAVNGDAAAAAAAAEATERISGLEAELEAAHRAIAEMKEEIEHTHRELEAQDAKFHAAAVESVEKIEALKDYADRLEDQLNDSGAQNADLRMELNSLTENEVHHRQMNDFYAGLLSNIQEQIAVAGSRPGSSASARDGGASGAGQHMEDLMGVVRQSLDAAGLGMRANRKGAPRTPPSRGRLTAHALRTAGMPGIEEGSPSQHNEYHARERGLGKPCFEMDMPASGAGDKDGRVLGPRPGGLQLPRDEPDLSGENTSPNASARVGGLPQRPWLQH
eukprot:jgi/Ulvmu1/11712/UM008_0123.1